MTANPVTTDAPKKPRRLWRSILIAFVILLALPPTLMFLVGSSLPATRTVSGTHDFAVPREAVWAVLTDIESFPTWQKQIKAVERVERPGVQEAWMEHYDPVQAMEPEYSAGWEVLESRAPEYRKVFGNPEMADYPYYNGIVEYTLTSQGAGSTLAVREAATVDSPFMRFSDKYLIGERHYLDWHLGELVAEVERRGRPMRTP